MVKGIPHPSRRHVAPPASERRAAGRLNCAELTCSLGDVLDASATGLRIRLRRREPPRTGAPTLITIHLPSGPLTLAASVVWTVRRTWGKRLAGLRFLSVSPEQRRRLTELVTCAGQTPDELSRLSEPAYGHGLRRRS